MANADKFMVQGTIYNVVSPSVFGEFIETIGGACTNPDGYAVDDVFLAMNNNVQALYKATEAINQGANIVENTNCEQTSLKDVKHGGSGASSADQVSYDNTTSHLTGDDVQEAIDEVAAQNQTLTNKVTDISDEIADMNNVLGAKNLLPNDVVAQTISGITLTKNSDGTVNVHGTNSAADWVNFYVSDTTTLKKILGAYKGKKLILSVTKDYDYDTNNVNLSYIIGGDTTWVVPNPKEIEFTVPNNIDSAVAISLVIGVNAGATANADNMGIMIRLASIQDDTYEPYSMTNREMTPYVQAISNPNLLDNPWFTVNQRGFTSTSTAEYTVDRWRLSWNPGNITVSLGNDGITLDATNATGLGYFAQFIDNLDIAGKVVTASVLLADGTIKTGTGVMPTKGSTGPYIITGEFNLYLQYNSNNDTPRLYISIGEGHSVTIRAIKLELGSVSTLAQDTAPNYQQELAKCQRYFQRFKPSSGYAWIGMGIGEGSTSLQVLIDLPVVMRANPTISYADIGVWSNDESGMLSSIVSDGVTGNKIHARVTSNASFTSGRAVCLWLNSAVNAYIDFSADL